jgi:hypothetical protein
MDYPWLTVINIWFKWYEIFIYFLFLDELEFFLFLM